MSGVEILAVEQVAIAWDYNWTVFWICFAVTFIISVALGIGASVDKCDWSYLPAAVIVGLFVGGFVSVLCGGISETPTEYTNQYKVTISDEVLLNEFNEQYKIIEQEGKIYIVRERETEQ